MSPAANDILAQALRLTEAEREWLVAEINESLDSPMSPEQEVALLELLEHRRAEYLSGRMELVDAEAVLAGARAKLAPQGS